MNLHNNLILLLISEENDILFEKEVWYGSSVGIHSPWVVVPWKQWCAWRSHQNKTKNKQCAQAVKCPSQCLCSVIKWMRNGQLNCLLNYFQYSNVTLLEMFVLNTDCLNFDSVLAAYNFIFEKLPSVCKYKEKCGCLLLFSFAAQFRHFPRRYAVHERVSRPNEM